jgi:hypothetical protein
MRLGLHRFLLMTDQRCEKLEYSSSRTIVLGVIVFIYRRTVDNRKLAPPPLKIISLLFY